MIKNFSKTSDNEFGQLASKENARTRRHNFTYDSEFPCDNGSSSYFVSGLGDIYRDATWHDIYPTEKPTLAVSINGKAHFFDQNFHNLLRNARLEKLSSFEYDGLVMSFDHENRLYYLIEERHQTINGKTHLFDQNFQNLLRNARLEKLSSFTYDGLVISFDHENRLYYSIEERHFL